MGCRYDWTYVEGEGATGDGGRSKEGSTSDGQTDGNAPPESDVSPPPPLPSKCKVGSSCALGSYCAFSDKQCGAQLGEGTCEAASPCTSQTVCACNKIAMDRCAAHGKGLDYDPSWAACGLGKTFKCGSTPEICARGAQFCHVKATGVPIGCKEIGACALGCACPEVESAIKSCGGSCDDKKEPGAIFVTCP